VTEIRGMLKTISLFHSRFIRLVRTVLCLVTCKFSIRRVLRNLQGRANDASEGGSPDVPSTMPKLVGHFGEY
jgi:hypothetical protein